MDHKTAAAELVDRLGLDLPPIALAFVHEAPAGVATDDAVVPSACAFWRRAENSVFYASAAAHANCPIGAFVMGFALAPEQMQELQGLIGQMNACGYVGAEEPAHIPTGQARPGGIVYGPLADFPNEPDAVLLWLTAAQAMVWSEATGGASWGGGAPTTVAGRPGCAAIPKAIAGDAPTLSLGCIGMRTFTGIGGERLLAVLPGARLADFASALAHMAEVNRGMQDFYESRLQGLQGGA